MKLPGEYEGKPIEVGIEQTFEAEMGTHRVISNDPDACEWIVLDTGGVSTYVVVDDDGTLLVAEKTWVGARLETE